MDNTNEYERLIKEGYIEEGTLVIKVDDITRMQLTEEQVKSAASNQGVRHDKGVVVIDKQGRMKKISSIMMGYNKKNIQLADGTFANADELLIAMEDAIKKLDAGTVIINKKGKIINPQDLLRVAEEAAGKIKVGEQSSKIENQDSRYWSIEGANSDVEHKKGIAFLGNDGIDLTKGDYVSVDELLTALNEYMVMSPSQKTSSTEPEEEKSNIVRVTRKYKDKLSRWLALLAVLAVLFSGIRIINNMKTIEIPVECSTKIVQIVEQDQLDFSIDGLEIESLYETIDQARQRIVSEYKIGDKVELQNGDVLYSNSQLQGNKVVIGQGIRQAGDYQISGVSILYNGNIYSCHVDTSVKNPGFDIGNFINQKCSENNLDLNKVEISLHFGNSSDYTRTGWINISKLITEDSIELQKASENLVTASTYDGKVENFNGSTITINGVNGPVTINVVDANGNLLAPGTIVIGSDGQQYKMQNLDLSSIKVLEEQTITETEMQQQQVVDGKKLTWSIQDCSLAAGIAPALAAIASAIITKKKNDEAQKNPNFFEFDNEEEYLKFKNDFIQAKENYEKNSGFKKMIKKLFYREEVDLLQRLTSDQSEQLYSIIRNWNDENYSYKLGDKIEFVNGKIIVKSSDGITQDITDIVKPAIASIGKDNKIEAEGLLQLEEEHENGIHR